MVCDTVVYHPSVTRFVKFLDGSAGREKILRLLQYLARFLAVQNSSVLARQLQIQFTTVRKFLRFLKPLNHLQAAAKFYDNKLASDNVVRVCSILKNIFFAAYLSLDQINLLRILKLIPVTALTGKKVPRWSNWCWLFGLLSGLVMDLRKIQTSHVQIATFLNANSQNQAGEKEDHKKALGKAYQDRYASLRRLFWDATDSFIVLNNLGYLSSNEEYVALSGVVTSILGMQDMWKAA
ncbi:pex11p [Saccharomyces arboricola H-6]|uniref:Pex11p n=1 Tax=Saccharomyces arboricola (strain H-6 / AS 2.3317 / CBS 10644) TaxID=1160507 RepID=J8PZF8_SACAR|nr:pex11p [Saccharomyces arboricola H-6]